MGFIIRLDLINFKRSTYTWIEVDRPCAGRVNGAYVMLYSYSTATVHSSYSDGSPQKCHTCVGENVYGKKTDFLRLIRFEFKVWLAAVQILNSLP